ncbi:MAG: DUF4274 domain-containing protein [Neomegalonema sp.]|nr:DUF4274 domain-containing protein [Neomegalonema sp.]
MSEITTWMLSQRSEVLHWLGCAWNWDAGIAELHTLCTLPQLDAGTARSLFWLAVSTGDAGSFTPEAREEHAQGYNGELELAELIARRAYRLGFASNDLCMGMQGNPRQDMFREAQVAELAEDLKAERAAGYIDWELSPSLISGGTRVLERSDFTTRELEQLEHWLDESGAGMPL